MTRDRSPRFVVRGAACAVIFAAASLFAFPPVAQVLLIEYEIGPFDDLLIPTVIDHDPWVGSYETPTQRMTTTLSNRPLSCSLPISFSLPRLRH